MNIKDNRDLKSLSLRVGSVFYMECFPEDGVVPKVKEDKSRHKYLIIVGIDDAGNYIAASLINTEINKHLAKIIERYQIEIRPEKYGFLGDKCRYADCYKIFVFEKERILRNADYIGYLDEQDMCEVRTLLKTSPLIDAFTIENFNL